MTAHPFAYPADAAGHVLYFDHPAERDYLRTAACTGCDFQAPAPGTGYARGRQLHTEAHHHLTWRCDQCGAMAAQHEGNRCPEQGPDVGHVDNEPSIAVVNHGEVGA